MKIIIILVTAVFAIFSTAVMSYISMATPIGPWIAPMLVLFATIIFKVFLYHFVKNSNSNSIALVTAGGSVGGILATAFGFSFPTLFFLNPDLFSTWMDNPYLFAGRMFLLAITAGGYGFLIANLLEKRFIVQEQMPFPIGQLTYKMIAAQNQIKKAWQLVAGLCATVFWCGLQSVGKYKGPVPHKVLLTAGKQYQYIRFPRILLRLDILPMLLAIGFITGHVIAIPLLVGALSKIFIVEPINFYFFSAISRMDFAFAFSSGLVGLGAVLGLLKLPKIIRNTISQIKNNKSSNNQWFAHAKEVLSISELALLGLLFICMFVVFNFSILQAFYLIVCTFFTSYILCTIAGKIGIAQLGRFATFVMLPFLFLFGINAIHVTIVSTFVEVCGGVAVDVLFGRKLAQLANINRSKIKAVQLLGIIVSSIAIGFIFWTLINNFGLGSDKLFAQRAQCRALLLSIQTFDLWVLAIGALFGLLLKKIKVNPMLVLGGLLMPFDYSLGLIAGGFFAMLVKDKDDWEPFWSGVFAANSIWELLKTIW